MIENGISESIRICYVTINIKLVGMIGYGRENESKSRSLDYEISHDVLGV